ncbi:hypothetical protein DRQ50_12050 [bacterium]|nr:MAG: hypothetical protein DRQ50_12050 [bacterium]
MLSRSRILLVLTALAFMVGACSDGSDPGQPGGSTGQLSAMFRGDISEDLVDFEFAALVSYGGDDPRPGPLLVRGRNIAYDTEAGTLTVDLSLVNDGDMTYPEPVGLTFVQFIPSDVTVLDADNDESGAGALFLFEFADDDGNWTPGEESLPRSVSFVVASGTSIGFVARIDVDMAPTGGSIGGIVWHDEDEDGQIGDDENGVGGVSIALQMGDDVSVTPLASVVTAEDGTYRFDGLDAGYYTVVRLPQDGMMGTTPPEMAVILVEMDGTVSDFLLANFGVKRGDDPVDDFVRVGDYVHAKGVYDGEPHRLLAEIFDVCHCDSIDDKHRDRDHEDCEEGDCDDDCDDGCRENDCWGRLAGPVTDFSIEDRYLEIMGTKVYFGEKCKWDDIERGARFRVDVARDADEHDGDVYACGHAKWWNGNRDRVKGFVQEVVHNDDGHITGVVILNTLVEVPRDMDRPE